MKNERQIEKIETETDRDGERDRDRDRVLANVRERESETQTDRKRKIKVKDGEREGKRENKSKQKTHVRHIVCYKMYKTLHTQSQSIFTFYFMNKYQPFNQRMVVYLRDIHNTQSNHNFTQSLSL